MDTDEISNKESVYVKGGGDSKDRKSSTSSTLSEAQSALKKKKAVRIVGHKISNTEALKKRLGFTMPELKDKKQAISKSINDRQREIMNH